MGCSESKFRLNKLTWVQFWCQRPNSYIENSLDTMKTSRLEQLPKAAAINYSCPAPWRGFTLFGYSHLFLKLRHCWYAANFVCAPPNPGSGSACSQYSSSQYLLRVRWGWSLVSWLWYSAVRKGWQLNKIYWFSLLKYLCREAATLLTTHQCGVMLLKELNAC